MSRLRVSRDKLVGIIVALACLAFSAVGMKIYDPPSYLYEDGIRNEPVPLQQVQVTVGEVAVGTRLVADGEVRAETPGMFVAVMVTLANPGTKRVYLNQAQLITQDRTYTVRSTGTLRADPGFAQTEQLLFEVDPAQIDDLTLEIWSSGLVYGFYARARIHLGITPDNAEQWRQAAIGRDLPERVAETKRALP